MISTLRVVAGSILGSDHVNPGRPGGRNGQDGYVICRSDECIVAVACDGCGSGKHSEVGAWLGAQLLAHALHRDGAVYTQYVREHPGWDKGFPYWKRALSAVTGPIATLAPLMGTRISTIIEDYFLFTIVGVLITERDTFLFHVGD